MSLPAPRPDLTCLVTGASSGIGEELARGLARRGYGVTLSGRREGSLEQLAEELGRTTGVRATSLAADLSEPKERRDLVKRVRGEKREVGVLVNCAGLGSGGLFVDRDQEAEMRIVRVNAEAMVDLCGAYAPEMARRGSGAILNVASIAGFAPIPRQATYAASKAFAISFSHALSTELKGVGVTVTTLCPGPTHTGFGIASGPQVQAVMEKLPRLMTSQPNEVAETGLRALESGRRHVTVGLLNKVNALSAYFTPRTLELAMMDRLYPVRE